MKNTTNYSDSLENRMTDSVFLEFLNSRRLTSITGDMPYIVESQSGKSYTASLRTRMDNLGSMYATWYCTCPARKGCHHIMAVVDMRWAEAKADEDYDAMDFMEREVID